MNKYTQHYFEKLAETNYQEKRRAEDILPMKGFIPAAQDYVLPFMGANRAGRAKAMALASGTKEKDIPLSVKHPLTYGVLSGLRAGAVGGLASAATLGGAVAANNWDLIDVNQNNIQKYVAATAGVGILAALGTGIAALVKARKNMRQISEKYESTDNINPEMPSIGTRFLPMSGFADKGEMDAYRYMKGKTNLKPRIGIATSLSSLPYVSDLAPLFGLYNKQQAINQQEEDMQPPPVRVRLGIG